MTTDPIYPVPQRDTTYGQISGEPYGTPMPEPVVPAPSWGVPPSQTTAAQASSILGSTQSFFQMLLGATGLDVPATNYTQDVRVAPPAQPEFTKGFLTGVDPRQAAMARAMGQSIPQVPGDDRVYMGHDRTTSPEVVPGGVPSETGTVHHGTTTVNAALNMPYLWSEDKVSETMKKMRAAGINVTDFDTMVQVWTGLVARASKTFVLSNGESLVTPWDMLSATKKENVANGTLDENGNIVRTSTSTSVNTLSEGQAWDTVHAAMQNMLGRDPTDQEVRDFLSAANADASRDPSKTVTTSRTDVESGQSNTTSRTTGGYTSADAARSAYEDIHNDADYGAYQSATTYFNSLLSALGEVAGSQ